MHGRAPGPRPAAGRLGLVVAGMVALTLLGASLAMGRVAHAPIRTAFGWRMLGVHLPMYPEFADLRSVTHRWDCVRRHIDNYRDGRCDLWGRPFNYPPLWLLPGYLGFGSRATQTLGLIQALLMIGAFWTLFSMRTTAGAVMLFLLALSPPVMFAIERGNVDLAIFVALVAALRLTRDLAPGPRDAWRLGALAGLTWLKLFPIAGLLHLARSRGRAGLVVLAAIALAGAVALTYRHILGLLQANTFHEMDDNYGRLALFTRDAAVSAWRGRAGVLSLVVALAAASVGAAFGAVRSRAWLDALPSLLTGDYEADLAAVGLGVFGLTFLIGLNFDYRLIFVVLIFPLLIRRDVERWNTAAAAAQALLLGRLVLAHRAPDLLLGGLDWVIFAGGAAWFAASAREAFGSAAVIADGSSLSSYTVRL